MTTRRIARRPAAQPSAADPTPDVARADEPGFHELPEWECIDLLTRNSVGRLAFSFHDRVDIRPLHYVHEDGRLYGRTSRGDKLLTLRHSPWVAFEVDEISGTFDWRSVVVHGTFYELPGAGSPLQRQAHRRAVELLRGLVPGTATNADPVAFRDVLFEIVIDTVTGRAATTKPG